MKNKIEKLYKLTRDNLENENIGYMIRTGETARKSRGSHSPDRIILEILQNADDSLIGDDKGKISVNIENDNTIIIEYNGKSFEKVDIEALWNCKSTKRDSPETTGEHGIGFKSIFNICDSVIIHSPETSFKYCKQTFMANFKGEIETFKEASKDKEDFKELYMCVPFLEDTEEAKSIRKKLQEQYMSTDTNDIAGVRIELKQLKKEKSNELKEQLNKLFKNPLIIFGYKNISKIQYSNREISKSRKNDILSISTKDETKKETREFKLFENICCEAKTNDITILLNEDEAKDTPFLYNTYPIEQSPKDMPFIIATKFALTQNRTSFDLDDEKAKSFNSKQLKDSLDFAIEKLVEEKMPDKVTKLITKVSSLPQDNRINNMIKSALIETICEKNALYCTINKKFHKLKDISIHPSADLLIFFKEKDIVRFESNLLDGKLGEAIKTLLSNISQLNTIKITDISFEDNSEIDSGTLREITKRKNKTSAEILVEVFQPNKTLWASSEEIKVQISNIFNSINHGAPPKLRIWNNDLEKIFDKKDVIIIEKLTDLLTHRLLEKSYSQIAQEIFNSHKTIKIDRKFWKNIKFKDTPLENCFTLKDMPKRDQNLKDWIESINNDNDNNILIFTDDDQINTNIKSNNISILDLFLKNNETILKGLEIKYIADKLSPEDLKAIKEKCLPYTIIISENLYNFAVKYGITIPSGCISQNKSIERWKTILIPTTSDDDIIKTITKNKIIIEGQKRDPKTLFFKEANQDDNITILEDNDYNSKMLEIMGVRKSIIEKNEWKDYDRPAHWGYKYWLQFWNELDKLPGELIVSKKDWYNELKEKETECIPYNSEVKTPKEAKDGGLKQFAVNIPAKILQAWGLKLLDIETAIETLKSQDKSGHITVQEQAHELDIDELKKKLIDLKETKLYLLNQSGDAAELTDLCWFDELDIKNNLLCSKDKICPDKAKLINEKYPLIFIKCFEDRIKTINSKSSKPKFITTQNINFEKTLNDRLENFSVTYHIEKICIKSQPSVILHADSFQLEISFSKSLCWKIEKQVTILAKDPSTDNLADILTNYLEFIFVDITKNDLHSISTLIEDLKSMGTMNKNQLPMQPSHPPTRSGPDQTAPIPWDGGKNINDREKNKEKAEEKFTKDFKGKKINTEDFIPGKDQNSPIIFSQEHRAIIKDLLDNIEEDDGKVTLYVGSPFIANRIGHAILDNFLSGCKNALSKNTALNIIIFFEYCNIDGELTNKNHHEDIKKWHEDLPQDQKLRFSAYCRPQFHAKNIILKHDNAPEKDVAYIGSYNWLSNTGLYSTEISIKTTSNIEIETLEQIYNKLQETGFSTKLI